MKVRAGDWKAYGPTQKAELLISHANQSAVFFLARHRQKQRKK